MSQIQKIEARMKKVRNRSILKLENVYDTFFRKAVYSALLQNVPVRQKCAKILQNMPTVHGLPLTNVSHPSNIARMACELGVLVELQHNALNHELQREQQYDIIALTETVHTNVPQLNQQQKIAYNTLIEAVNSGSGGIYIFDAPGGIGKTFLISLLLARIRWRNDVALALASSGIAATLLEGGRTAHSAL
ncbi:hypothetical protein HELRODRAFT_180370 [Helobdella robusta]|uniref:ATP-dependent DNA helicase n=1 Tax=Helobdella robusta TaxID=6412 RepID=T1FFU6_HELRO|nr:hypothetical protein HELRODRAFT_180370 [Helobdella robusta]ESN93959.1 hypothetical protein HELRODRAFT_180370 [Helobdella robusta]